MTSLTTLEEANAALTLRLRQQELAAEFANYSLTVDDLQSVLDEACRIAAHGMECSLAKVLMYAPETNDFLLQAGVGWQPGVVGHVRLGADVASPAGYAFKTGEMVLSNHLDNETRFRTPAVLQAHGVRCAFNVLIADKAGPYGVLEVDSPDEADFSLLDSAFLRTLASLLASAIAKQERINSLKRSQTLMERVLHASPDCVKLLDSYGAVEDINANGCTLMEVDDAAELRGQPWHSLWPADQQSRIRDAVDLARAGRIARFDAFCPTAKSTPKWWDVVVAPLDRHLAGGTRLVVISRDITERMLAVEAKDLLMLEVHHRVKNSLQMVQNLLSLQGRATDDEQAREQLMESAARVRTIAAIHDRLYQTGSALTVEVRPYLEGLVQDLRTGMASTFAERAIGIDVDPVVWPAAEMPTLGLVLTELVTNALKYGKGEVTVTFRQPSGSAGVLSVADEGCGLPADFDPTHSRGLGMRLVKGLLRGDGAGLAIDRSQGHTRFIARMPAQREFAAAA